MSHVVVGIDPGAGGALACFVDGELLTVEDMPTFTGKGSRRTVNAAEVARLIEQFGTHNGGRPTVVIEQVNAFRGASASSSFAFGDAYGVVRSVPLALGCPTTFVTPRTWKRALGLGANKHESRKMASYLFPSCSSYFARNADDGRAEAALIAYWWTQQ